MVRSYARLAQSSGQDIVFLMAETSRYHRALRIAAHNYLADQQRSAAERAMAARNAAVAAMKGGRS